MAFYPLASDNLVLDALQASLSPDRFATYLAATRGDRAEALRLYTKRKEASQSDSLGTPIGQSRTHETPSAEPHDHHHRTLRRTPKPINGPLTVSLTLSQQQFDPLP